MAHALKKEASLSRGLLASSDSGVLTDDRINEDRDQQGGETPDTSGNAVGGDPLFNIEHEIERVTTDINNTMAQFLEAKSYYAQVRQGGDITAIESARTILENIDRRKNELKSERYQLLAMRQEYVGGEEQSEGGPQAVAV